MSCIFNLETTACDSSPCQNGGTCFSNDDGYICRCNETLYTGANCETGKSIGTPGEDTHTE